MEKPKIYLETTMFSFYYEKRQEARYQELRSQTRQVFDLNKGRKIRTLYLGLCYR